MPSCRAGLTVSNLFLRMLAEALRRRHRELGTTWRRLDPGRQAMLVLAHLRKGETCRDLAVGFAVGTTTVYRRLREGARRARRAGPTLDQAFTVAAMKVFVTLDGTLLRIDRGGMTSGCDRGFYSGKHKCLSVRASSPGAVVGNPDRR